MTLLAGCTGNDLWRSPEDSDVADEMQSPCIRSIRSDPVDPAVLDAASALEHPLRSGRSSGL